MPFPVELVSLAVRGTNQQTILQHSPDTTLRDCAVHAVKHQAGFVPAQAHQKLATPCAFISSNTSNIGHQSLKHLHIILDDYPMMLQEWIQSVCSVNKTIPDEYIPYFLTVACLKPNLQKWLKLIISKRAEWLIEQVVRDDWNWINNCDVSTIDDLITIQNNENWKSAYQINVSLAQDPLYWEHHKGLQLLLEYPLLWRQQTANSLIEAMFVANVTASYTHDSLFSKVIEKAAYYLPLNFSAALLAALNTGHDDWKTIIEQVQEIFDLRYEMLATILENN